MSNWPWEEMVSEWMHPLWHAGVASGLGSLLQCVWLGGLITVFRRRDSESQILLELLVELPVFFL